MLDRIDSPPDVMAFRMSGKISGDDLDSVMDELDRLMAGTHKVHIFVETSGIDGIEISRLPSYASRAMPLLGKLDRFGRIAVVADQTWIRLATRLESLLLPGISYRTCLPEERDEALAWVCGATDA